MAMSDIEKAQGMYDDLSRLGVQSGFPAGRRLLVEKAQIRGVLDEWPTVLSDIEHLVPKEHQSGAAWKACTDPDVWDDRVYCSKFRAQKATELHNPSPRVSAPPDPEECFDPTGGVTGLMEREGLTFLEALKIWKPMTRPARDPADKRDESVPRESKSFVPQPGASKEWHGGGRCRHGMRGTEWCEDCNTHPSKQGAPVQVELKPPPKKRRGEISLPKRPEPKKPDSDPLESPIFGEPTS